MLECLVERNTEKFQKLIDKAPVVLYDKYRRVSGKRRGVEQFGSSSGS